MSAVAATAEALVALPPFAWLPRSCIAGTGRYGVARGFESKSVADQQEGDFRDPPPAGEREPAAVLRTRRRLELARLDVQARLKSAQTEAHRQLLERSLEALAQQLAALGAPRG